ncbi:hypothetical protein AJ79_00941 [Helicocarpus griseus UAMH5409]|uniref:RING-CH-type domain-containing protein n=1 Tax=Helicocarpus griseus UAMH5409 TaxID=1447875 RepID=A0A2B7Y9B5_9EURO|nr:hypothetical protein AJ79_00941 [Helicocarpus griseus UAMH5409]
MASLPQRSSSGRQRASAAHQATDNSYSTPGAAEEVPQSETDISSLTNPSTEHPDVVFPTVSRSSAAQDTESARQPSSDIPPQQEGQQEQTREQEREQQQQDQPSAMGDPSSSSSSPPSSTNAIQKPTSTSASPSAPDSEPRKCWICYTDETEDTPLNNEWRSPCPCALTAHEACLLDWLADLENPASRKRNGRPTKMHCPQCKSEIVISRPRSFVVDLVRAVERLAGRLVLPGMVFTLAGTVWAGCCAHGVYSIYFIFGSEDAQRIFQGRAGEGAATWNPRLNFGLPLIPIVLILSRTKYAEGLLPAIPVLFFATHQPGSQELEMDFWPPSAAMTFAALPYAKSFYSMLYEKLFGKLERRWIAEVQPRAGEDAGADGQQGVGGHGVAPDVGNGDILMEIDLELQVGLGGGGNDDDDNNNDNLPALPEAGGDQQQQQQQQHQQPNGEGAQVNGAGGEGEAAQNQAAAAAAAADAAQGNQILGRRQEGIIHETSNLADTVLGALLFPAISASMGGMLKMALPKAWTTAPAAASAASSSLEKGKSGLLQSKWGRSVVGGCLFVLLKDALVLYCRWKLAKTHRKRRVLNYDRAKKQVVGRS